MKANQATFPVRVKSRLLGVSASGFYAWVNRSASARAVEDIGLTALIHAIHRRSGGAYGAPSIQAELADDHQRRVPLAPLDTPDVGPVLTRLVRQFLLAPTPSAAATCSPLLGQVVPFNRLADADVARTATPVSTTPSDPALGWTYFRPGPKSSRHEGHVSRSRSSVLT